MGEDERQGSPGDGPDDLAARRRAIEQREEELEKEDHEVEELEGDARAWLEGQTSFHWPAPEDEDDDAGEPD
jgi:hypothetical protein